MASLSRPTEATYEIHDRVTVETSDNEDHTFCGVMFPVKCKDSLPLDRVIIKSISVRGRLGPLTVWVSNEEHNAQTSATARRQFRMHSRFWTKIYEKTHAPSCAKFQELDLSENPIVLLPGQVRAIYVHSTLPGDEAIVYDNRHHRRTYDDALVSILTGRAHVSETPFGTTPIWGWGNPWRDQREFVGRIEYGAVYKLWNPHTALEFGSKFQKAARTLFLCQRRWESPLSMLPDDCIFYILNMCRWDWVNDTPKDMKEWKRERLTRAANQQAAEQAPAEARVATSGSAAATAATTTTTTSETRPSPVCCTRRCLESDTTNENDNNEEDDDDDDSDFHDAQSAEESHDDDEEEDVELQIVHDNEEEEEEQSDDDDDDETWEEDDGYNANSMVFRYHDDSEDEEDVQDQQRNRQAWIRRQFARIHVLQALAALEDDGIVEMDD